MSAFKIGEIVNTFEIISIRKDYFFESDKKNDYKRNICTGKCTHCGKIQEFAIRTGLGSVCTCELERKKKEQEDFYRSYIGKIYDKSKIIDFFEIDNHKFFKLECSICGNQSKLVCGKIIHSTLTDFSKGCKKCGYKTIRTGLDEGREKWAKIVKKDGTDSYVRPRKNNNKNNQTGVPGVCIFNTKCKQKYRAYINLKGQHYHLGIYDTIEEAQSIREEANRQRANKNLDAWFATFKEI